MERSGVRHRVAGPGANTASPRCGIPRFHSAGRPMKSEYAASTPAGAEMHTLIRNLYPICRSITGDGFRASLRRLAEIVPIELTEVPTGTRVLDWTVPKEWNIRDAWIADASGRRVVDFKASNLHVVNYSAPVRARLPLAELRSRLHALLEQPALIP